MSEPTVSKADVIACKQAVKREKLREKNDIKPQRFMWLWCAVAALGLAAVYDKRNK